MNHDIDGASQTGTTAMTATEEIASLMQPIDDGFRCFIASTCRYMNHIECYECCKKLLGYNDYDSMMH